MKLQEKDLKKILILNLGFLMLTFTIVNFLIPSKLTAGGTAGMAMILYYAFHIPISLGIIIFSIPLLIGGCYVFGLKYGINTIYGIIIMSFDTHIIYKWARIDILNKIFHEFPLAGSITSGILAGTAISIIVSSGGNTGGTIVISQILEKYFNFKVGTTLNIINVIIVSFSGFTLGKGSVFLTILSLIICGVVLNLIEYRKKQQLPQL